MKQFNKMLALVVLLVLPFASAKLSAQTAPTIPPADGEYRSTGAVNFTLATNWEMASGGTWSAAASAPNGTKTITIQSATTLTVDQPVTVTGYIKNAGTIVLVATTTASTTTSATTTGSNNVALTASNPSIAVGQILNAPTGTAFPAGVQVTGISGTSLTLSQTALGAITSSFAYSFYSNYLTFSTGTYEHAQDGGAIPISIWGATSTCLITGVVATAPGTNATSCQNFGNFIWDCTNQTTASLTMAWAGITFQGNVTIKNTGTTGVGSGLNAGSIRLSSANPLNNANITAVPITINGDLIIGTTTTKANVSTSGSGGLQVYNVTVKGNINVGTSAFGGSTWGIAGGSGGPAILTLTGTNGNGDFIVAGTSSTLTANNATKVIFAKAGTQLFSYPVSASVGLVTWEVSNGTTLNLGSQVISGGGGFIMNTGATLMGSINTFSGGNIQTTNKLINTGANFVLNGSTAQILAFPSTSSVVAYSYATAAFPIGATNIILSVANSNIQVGQTITGTSIPAGATVAAISGTSLTLSTALTAILAVNTALTFSNAAVTKQSINNLTISNTAASPGVTISTIPVTVNGVLSFGSVNNATLTTGGNLVIGSSASGTGRIADITNAGANSGNVISGNVTVQRYIPSSNRAYRFLSPSVTTTGFIKANWQEGTSNPNTSTNNNPNPGYGTHITGSTAGLNGFDATVTGNASLYQFNNTTQLWSSIANTDATVLTAGNAYRILIRGDRSTDLNTQPASNTATTLRATGSLLTGSVIMNSTGAGATAGMPLLSAAIGGYSFVGNPYASPVNWDNVYTSAVGLEDYYYTWDPTRGTHGAYVYWDKSDGANGGSVGSAVNQHIQPGQAIFVRSSSATPVLTFNEAHKSSSFTNTFRTQTTLTGKLSIGLTNTALMAANNGFDGANILFADNFSGAIDGEDIPKMNNQDENLSVYSNTTNLMKESRPTVTANDTVQLRIWQLASNSYILTFDAQQFTTNKEAYLLDGYLNTSSPISIAGNSQYAFTTNATATSYADTRFKVVFRTSGALPVSITNLKAYQKNTGILVEWNTANETNMSSYEVEKSIDGTGFNKAGTVGATGLSAYNWYDANPINGNNYYRIKMVEKNGTAKYTQVVNVKIGGTKDVFTVIGNPVKNKTVTLQMENVQKGNYSVTVFNNLGQQVARKVISHAGGSATETVALGNIIPGSYQLSITGSNVKETVTIIVE